MPKVLWYDLIERFPEANLVVAVLPDRSGEKAISNGQEAQQLLIRFLKKLRIQGEYAVTILRHEGRREVVCAFRDPVDAVQVAGAIGVSANYKQGAAIEYRILMRPSVEQRIWSVAGPPATHKVPRKPSYGRS